MFILCVMTVGSRPNGEMRSIQLFGASHIAIERLYASVVSIYRNILRGLSKTLMVVGITLLEPAKGAA